MQVMKKARALFTQAPRGVYTQSAELAVCCEVTRTPLKAHYFEHFNPQTFISMSALCIIIKIA